MHQLNISYFSLLKIAFTFPTSVWLNRGEFFDLEPFVVVSKTHFVFGLKSVRLALFCTSIEVNSSLKIRRGLSVSLSIHSFGSS